MLRTTILLVQRERADAEVAQLVVEGLPVGHKGVALLGLLRRLQLLLRPLKDGDLSVLTLGEALGILVERAACGFR